MSAQVVRREFARQVNEARLARHLSVRAVGRLARVPAATAQGWLSGEHFPSPALRTNYLELLDYLGLIGELPAELHERLAGSA